ncbi:unnamed protein product [Meganyctiphanes norvegica]|uniref:Caspase family p20 domain-containing protein n=1 Tax=Meganyctiphanes norvegica TaxID=48144 RepID=A0AAV2S6Z3_MEGNR
MKSTLTASELEVVNVLLGHPRVDVNKRSGYGDTALMVAAFNGHTDACNVLMKAGADITANSGATAIWWAAAGGHRQITEAIVSWGGDPKKTDKHGVSPAEAARRAGHKELGDWLDGQEQLPSRRVGQIVSLEDYSTHIYRNTRGRTIVLNYMNYTNSKHDMTRHGADVDERNLRQTFEQVLGYSFDYNQNLTFSQTEAKLNAIAKDPSMWYEDSMVLVIGTHGGERTMFVTSDNKKYDITWVKDIFSDDNCPALKNKPKVIIYNACRGSYLEDGPAASGRIGQHEVMFGGKPKKALYKISHLITLFSCSEDITSLRSPLSGSCFLSALCTTLRNNPKDELNVITRKIAKVLEDKGVHHPQVVKEEPFFNFVFKCSIP